MRNIFGFYPAILIIVLVFSNGDVSAAPTTGVQAQKAATGWLSLNNRPLGVNMAGAVIDTQTFSDQRGDSAYHVVYLEPGGFVIVSGDDLLEPVVAFAEDGVYDPSPDNPLGALIQNDLKQRVQAIRQNGMMKKTPRMHRSTERAGKRWNALIYLANTAAGDPGDLLLLSGQPSISDMRVDPLVLSKWGQTTCCESPRLACYNYYTPLYPPATPDGDPNNYPTGCVATAMAQVMRYHTYPSGPTTGNAYSVVVDGNPVNNVMVRGGDGAGGPYNWGQMVYQPDCTTVLTDRQAIGALLFDAGISVNMSYTSTLSTSNLSVADTSLVSEFSYSNSVWGSWPNLSSLIDMINPNLDYAHPVILGINSPQPEHAIVVDGYGYIDSVPYHHLNMGWEGLHDAWYNFYADMPEGYSTVFETVYNIFVTDGEEIISGRVMDAFGSPLAGETVTALRSGGGLYQAVTNARGIYAIAHILPASTYTVSVSNPGFSFNDQIVNTATSTDGMAITGNVWGVDFTPFGGSGNNIYVDANSIGNDDGTSWIDAFNYLQDALSAASSGDKIFVAEGVYKPDESSASPEGTDDRGATFQLISGVEIYGGFPRGGTNLWTDRDVENNKTTLSGDIGVLEDNADNSIRIVTASQTDSASVLDGFTIRDGNGNSGAGIYNYQGNAVIANCIIRNNIATSNGAGMYNSQGSPTVRNCTFTENLGVYGGAMANRNVNNGLLLENCSFIENTAVIVGAAIDNKDSSVTNAINCEFIRNHSNESGGAIYNAATINLINCAFMGNSVIAYYGGGLRNQVASGQVTNCLFVGNTTAHPSNGHGAGVFNYRSNIIFSNCTFADNVSAAQGGGMHNYAGSASENDVTVNNCIFWNNEDSGGIDENAQIYNSPSTTPSITYSCIQDVDPDDGSIPYGGAANNNIDDNPLFERDPNDGGDGWGDANDDYGDLHLKPNSPCVNTGLNSLVAVDTFDLDNDTDTSESIPFDLDKHQRFADSDCDGVYSSLVDRGSYEFAWIYLGDLDGDCDIDLNDFSILAGHWLKGTSP